MKHQGACVSERNRTNYQNFNIQVFTVMVFQYIAVEQSDIVLLFMEIFTESINLNLQ